MPRERLEIDSVALECQAGDWRRFDVLYAEVRRFVEYVVKSRVFKGSFPNEVEDALQSVWLRILKYLHTFDRSKGDFRGWLYLVARHGSIVEIRRHQRRRQAVLLECETARDGDEDARTLLDVTPSGARPSDETVALRERAYVLRRLMSRRSPRDRKILRAHLVHEKTLDEVGSEFGLAPQRVHQIVQEAQNDARAYV